MPVSQLMTVTLNNTYMLSTSWQAERPYLVGSIFFKKLNTRIAKHAQVHQAYSISVIVVGDKTMRQLNKQWRKKDRPTDVLSFPFLEDKALIAPIQKQKELGEVVVNFEQAARQAKERGHSLRHELAVLYVHGVLHLLGYDHGKSNEARVMKQLEQKIMQ